MPICLHPDTQLLLIPAGRLISTRSMQNGSLTGADGSAEFSVWRLWRRLWSAHSDAGQQFGDTEAQPGAQAQEEQQAYLRKVHCLRGGTLSCSTTISNCHCCNRRPLTRVRMRMLFVCVMRPLLLLCHPNNITRGSVLPCPL